MSAIGRISGPLLKSNLIRNGIDLAFETDLLYLDVNNQRIGIKTATPQHELDVNGTTRTVNLVVTNRADIGDVNIVGNTISSDGQYLNLGTLDNVVYQNKLRVDSIDIENNVISTNNSNAPLELRPNGTGSVDVYADMNVTGNIYATGNISADGNIIVGNANTDNITFNAEVASNIIPDLDSIYNLGEPGIQYDTDGDFTVGDITITVASGVGTLSVPASGPTWVDDVTSKAIGFKYLIALQGFPATLYDVVTTGAWTGTNPQQASVTVTGLADGTYNIIRIDLGAKRWKDVRVSNIITGDITTGTIVVDGVNLTLRQGNIYYVAENGDDDNTGNHPQDPFATLDKALTLASAGDTVYLYPGVYTEIFPLTVPAGVTIKGHGIRAVKIVPTVGTQNNDAFLLNGETTVEDLTVADFYTGYAFKFAPGFTVTSRSPYVRNVSVITKGSVTTAEDPRGFNQGDAGKGAYLDGSVATAGSNEASCLFHSVTFITPGVDCIELTNGVRIEWLNSFTYFANRSIYAYDGASGIKGTGQTALRVDEVTGSFNAGETVTYYDTDGVTVLATGTIAAKDTDGKFYINGKQSNFETAFERGGKTIQAFGDAKLSTAVKKFGTASLVLDGAGDYAFIQNNADFQFGTGDFTIEGWFYRATTGIQVSLFDFRTATSQSAPWLFITAGGALVYNVNNTTRTSGVSGVAAGSWYHVALCRNGTNTRMFVNGTQIGLTWTDTTDYIQSPLTLGSRFSGDLNFNGYIDDVRIIKGVGLYTANFTAPVTRALVTPETVLMARFDGDNNSTTFTDDVVYAQDIRFSGGATAQYITLTDFTDFGAEVRLIGSASVYGNFGLVGDGPGVLMYAIGHNLAYIGNGKEVTNDPETVIQANEVVEANNAKIRYNSVDHKGDFRVGDLFYVNQETGSVAFSVSDFTINTTGGVTFVTGPDTTFISGEKIETGDWRISGNTIETLTQDANFTSASGQINLQDNVDITGNLDVTGNVTIGGNIVIGDEATDTIQIVAGIDSDIIPRQDSTYSLGTAAKTWANLYVNQINVDGIRIRDNYIESTESNANLELRASGTGIILVPSNDVQIDNNLTVDGLTTLANTNITGTVTLFGNFNQTGNYTVSNNLTVGQNLTVGAAAQFEEILIDDNVITTTTSNTDLELRASGTGNVIVPNNDVEITNDLTVSGNVAANNLNVSANITSNTADIGDITISGTTVEATASNADLELRANGTGDVLIPSSDVILGQALTVNGSTFLQGTSITGTLTHVGDTVQTGNVTLTGDWTNSNISISDNLISTTLSNSDLELVANGTGSILIPSSDVVLSQNLTVSGVTDLQAASITGTLNHVGDTTQTGNYTITGQFGNGDIVINDNYITTTQSNSDLELRANGTGVILVPTNDVEITNDLTVSGLTTLANTNITGTVTHIGAVTQTGNINLTGNYSVTGTTAVSGVAQFEDINITNNVITTTLSNSDLELRAAGTGEVIVPNNDVRITNDLVVDGTITVGDITSSGTITANRFSTGDILIDDNFITTTTSNSDLELRANGTGEVIVPQNNVILEQDLTVNGTTNLKDTNITGNIVHVGNTTQTGDLSVTGALSVDGNIAIAGGVQFENIKISGNVVETTLSNSDLELRANGSGQILIPTDNVTISNNLTVVGTLTVGDIVSTGQIQANRFFTGDILVDDNYITTTTSNSDLELRTSGTGSVIIDTFDINGSTIATSGDMTLDPGSDLLIIDSTGSLKLPAGTTAQRPAGVAGQIRYNSELSRFEGFNGTNWVNLKGVEDLDGNTRVTAELTEGANDNVIRFYTNGSLVVDIDSTRLNAPQIIVDSIRLDGNVISTITANTDLVLGANGTGSVVFDNFAFRDNTITNRVSNSITLFQNTNDGYVKFDGTYGLVLPVGNNLQRPPLAFTETGMARFNTEASRVEVYDGTNWVSAAGTQSGITFAEAEDIALQIVLSLG